MTAPSNALRDLFLASAHVAVERLSEYASQLEVDPTDDGVLDALRRELHRLGASAAAYEFTEATERLRRMEERASAWVVDRTLEPGMRGALVRQLVEVLQPAFSGRRDPKCDELSREVWCVESPPGDGAEWGKFASVARVRFVLMSATVFHERLQARERPYAVFASTDVGRSLQLPDGLPLVLFTDPLHALAAQGRSFGAVTVVDQNISTEDLAIVLDRLAQRAAVAGGSVVVLDDDPMILLLSKAICEDAGLRTVAINDPAKLLPTLDAERPGVLLMDVQLPGTTGFALTRMLRASTEWAAIPIILFSSETSPEAREQAAAAGASGFIGKPVAPAELRAQLLARLEQVRQNRFVFGLNPVTGLAERELGLRESEQLFGAFRREGGALTAAVIRLADPSDDSRWPNACAHLARTLGVARATVAHYDDVSLVATSREGFDPLLRALEQLRLDEPGDPAWVVGIADARTVAAPRSEDLWHAAADAAAAAITNGQRVRPWHDADSTRAPDVIVVEDDEALSELLEYALSHEGYTYQLLRTGPEALEALRTLKVGSTKVLILLDLDLPGLDGHAIHERLRLERPRDFVVVFISVHAGDADQVRALRAGAADYLVKPVSLRVLMSKVPRWARQPRSGR